MSTMTPMATAGIRRTLVPRLCAVALACACLFAFFWRLGGNGLFDLDEGLYTEAAREMHATGDWVVPRVHGKPFFEKPPLIYWQAAAAFTVLGRSEAAARLPSACASAAVVLLLAWFGTRTLGWRAGMLGGFFVALSPLVVAESRQLITDATLNLWIAAALISFYVAQARAGTARGPGAQPSGPTAAGVGVPRAAEALAPIAFWVACALGVLAKGLPGILIPCLTGLLYLYARARRGGPRLAEGIRAMRPGAGLVVFIAIAAPWHLAAWHAAGREFYGEYIIRQHLGRLRGGDTSHREAIWFYLPVFLALALPWSTLFPAALARALRKRSANAPAGSEPHRDDARRLLAIWASVVFVVFSASGSKLVSYILPMFPPAALLTADWALRAEAARGRRAVVAGAASAAVVAGLIALIVALRDPIAAAVAARTHRPVDLASVSPALFSAGFHIAASAALGAAACVGLTLSRGVRWGMGGLVTGMAAVASVAVLELLPAVDAQFIAPADRIARLAGERAGVETPLGLMLGSPGRPSLLFYLPDSLVIPREGAQGVVEVRDAAAARAFMAARPRALLMADARRAAEIAAAPGVRVVHSDGPWSLLSRE